MQGAARALAVATEADLRDYWHLSAADTARAARDLVGLDVLRPVAVAGWPPAYRHRDASVPRARDGSGLLAPLDPLIWNRSRAERVFGMRYRHEIHPGRASAIRLLRPALPPQGSSRGAPGSEGGPLMGRLLVRSGWSQHGLSADSSPLPSMPMTWLATWLDLAAWLDLETGSLGDARGDLAAALHNRGAGG